MLCEYGPKAMVRSGSASSSRIITSVRWVENITSILYSFFSRNWSTGLKNQKVFDKMKIVLTIDKPQK